MKKSIAVLPLLMMGFANTSSADIVHLDDVIIQFSLCVGNDCVNGESFGFDTLRLKENNVRLHFDDTSTSASFPKNDWRIIANDSANGGASYLAIEDSTANRIPFRVVAGAPSNSLYVNSNGNVGMGTSTPSVQLDIVDGNTPTTRLQQDGSSGFTPQTWDVAGNETNFFIRDATNGSTLPFRIKPGAPSNSIYINSTGNVGMGTASPSASADLHIIDNGPARIELENSSITNSATLDKKWIFNSNGTLRISAGSDASEFTLNANGDLTITGQLTTATSTYPDYVFQPGYKLMNMEDLRQYIGSHGRLPNMPAAEDVVKNGLNLTEMHVKLMEKVEELTLYTLEQESTIDELKKRLVSLEQDRNVQ